jgi:signal transduction histidine kinase
VAWAIGVIDASYFQFLTTLDYVFLDILTDGNASIGPPLNPMVEYSIVLVACLVPALPRFERPLTMVLCSLGLIFVDWLMTTLVFLSSGHLLPLASPVVGVFGVTAVLQAMAWSDERERRTRVEHLNQARLQFTDMLVHDLKKRMSTILTSLSLLGRREQSEARHEELLATLRTSAERLLLEINNLLDIRKIEECGMRAQRERIEVGPLLREILVEHQSAADLAGVRFSLTGGSDGVLFADRQMLFRVMTNLLWNAIQHAPEGSDIEVGCAVSDGWIGIHVANQGDPIPVGRQKLMFQPFLSSLIDDTGHRLDGMGLGLTFCRLAVEAHGGSIHVESPCGDRGEGARISIRLPSEGALQGCHAP